MRTDAQEKAPISGLLFIFFTIIVMLFIHLSLVASEMPSSTRNDKEGYNVAMASVQAIIDNEPPLVETMACYEL